MLYLYYVFKIEIVKLAPNEYSYENTTYIKLIYVHCNCTLSKGRRRNNRN